MPLVSFSTNVQLGSDDARKAFTSEFSKFCAKTVGKDEAHFNVDVHFNPYLMFGGTFEPAFMLKILSLDNVNAANSREWSKGFSTFFKEKLGVPNDRGLMAFTDPGPAFIGTRGSTVEAIRAAGSGV